MLIEFTVGNYRSFRDPQTLSLVAAPLKSKDKRLDANNVIQIEGQPDLLASTTIYGANASGKSNLIDALRFMRDFVMNSQEGTRRTGGIDCEPFRLHATSAREPSHFEAVFIHDGLRYRYGFDVNSDRVVAEWLYMATSARESGLFKRDYDEISVGTRFRGGRQLTAQTRPNALFLSVAAQFNSRTAEPILEWFGNLGIVYGIDDFGLRLYSAMESEKAERLESIRRLVCRLDLGIADLKVEKLPRTTLHIPDSMPEDLAQALQPLQTFLDKSAVEMPVIRTIHTVYDDNGQPIDQQVFDLDKHESEGTRKLFALTGPILETLEQGKVLVVDELDARLHPLMTREIVRLFNDRKTNPRGAQLIFTTQDTNLLDNELLRRDQIWFVEKDRYGASRLYSLAEFKGVRNDLSYERGYIEGRFGAIPYLNPNKLRALFEDADDGA